MITDDHGNFVERDGDDGLVFHWSRIGKRAVSRKFHGSFGSRSLHGELDILRLNLAPALDLSFIPVFWESLEVFPRQFSRKVEVLRELFADVGVFHIRRLGNLI